MELLPKAVAEKLPPLYSTEEIETEDKIVQVKYFTPFSNWTWYAIEYDPAKQIFFGLVDGLKKEWGYFSLEEFEGMNRQKPIPLIERDLYFEPKKIKELGVIEIDD